MMSDKKMNDSEQWQLLVMLRFRSVLPKVKIETEYISIE